MSVRDREDALVTRLQQLGPALDGEPDPAFREATRARLVAMAAVRTPEPEPATGLRRLLAVRAPDGPPPRWRGRLTAALAGGAMAVTALAGLVAVADDARPGDPLYDLKRGTEQTQLALAGDARGQTLLDFATTRFHEIEEMTRDGEVDAALVVETLRTMDAQTREGTAWLTDRSIDTGNAQPLDVLSGWAAGQSSGLAGLEAVVPGDAAAAVGRSLTLLADIGARTDGLRTALTCAGGPAVGGADALGPVPTNCVVPAPASPGTPAPAPSPAPVPTPPTQAVPTPVLPAPVPQAPAPSTQRPGGTAPGGPAGVPAPVPTPALPLPSISVQLPVPGTGGSTGTPEPLLRLCLPPLITINCR